jgi:hypothetical protein
VPGSNSDLYQYKFHSTKQHNPHDLLFEEQTFPSFNPNPEPELLGQHIFLNNTRVQVRDMTKQTC